jgi:hypothetical protein
VVDWRSISIETDSALCCANEITNPGIVFALGAVIFHASWSPFENIRGSRRQAREAPWGHAPRRHLAKPTACCGVELQMILARPPIAISTLLLALVLAATTRDRGSVPPCRESAIFESSWIQGDDSRGEDVPIDPLPPFEAEPMHGPLASPRDGCPTGTIDVERGADAFDRYAVVSGACHGLAIEIDSAWWYLDLGDREADPPRLLDVDARTPGAELVLRAHVSYAPNPPNTWAPYTVESVVICGLGPSHVPSCIDATLGDNSELPQHQRLELTCSGALASTVWEARKPPEGGGTAIFRMARRFEFL